MAKISPALQKLIDIGDVVLSPGSPAVADLHRRQLVKWHIYSRDAAGVRSANYTVVEATVERMSRRAADGNTMDVTAMASVSRPQKSAVSKAAAARVVGTAKAVVKPVVKLPKPPKPTKPVSKTAGKTASKTPNSLKAKLATPVAASMPAPAPAMSAASPAASPVAPDTHVILVFDESGSMAAHEGSINAQAEAIRQRLIAELPTAKVDIVRFGTSIEWTPTVSAASHLPKILLGSSRGGTALYSATTQAAQKATKLTAPTLVYLLTDGEAMDSAGNTSTHVAAALATGRVTFACVGPAAAASFFKSCGIPEACIRQWDGKDTTDLTKITTQVTQGVSTYAAAVKSGKSAVDTFFIDAVKQGITIAAAKSQLRDITSSLRRRKISKFVEMEAFVKTELKREYVPGAGYYQVYKAETLKQGRRIILQPRGEDIFLAGPAARKLLGLPEDRDVRVEPKNLGDFIIYFQSASPNRKLPPDTTLLYDESHVAGATVPTWSVMGGTGAGGAGASSMKK